MSYSEKLYRLLVVLCACISCAAVAGVAAEGRQHVVQLCSPVTTLFTSNERDLRGIRAIVTTLVVPENAPDDLGVGVFIADDDGTWWQGLRREMLRPGRHELRFDVSDVTVRGEPHQGRWSSAHAQLAHECGLFFFSSSLSRSQIVVEQLQVVSAASNANDQSDDIVLHDFDVEGVEVANGSWKARAGNRVTWSLRPDPFPSQVYDDEQFSVSMTFTSTDIHERISGYYRQPMNLHDRGTNEEASPAGADHFQVRWRPRRPGIYKVDLKIYNGDGERTVELPALHVVGEPSDPFVRVDPYDQRFFSTGDGQWYWPVGINGHSVFDTRCAMRTGSRLSPNRGWHAYRAYLDRWSHYGITATELWMAPWNLALEWRDDWPGYHGLQTYSQANAERLDRILDHALRVGIRTHLVIYNHGQMSTRHDKQWALNPWNAHAANNEAGPLDSPFDWFRDQRSLDGQDQLRRYIVARWADHPAVLGWKIISEEDITDASHARTGDQELMRRWHQHTAGQWQKLDVYQHPVTSHWSHDYDNTDRKIVAMPELDYVTIDAYNHPKGGGRNRRPLAGLVWDGLHDRRGLQHYNKPVVITEFGVPVFEHLQAEHKTGPWASFVSGYGGAAMLWWFEWVDQRQDYSGLQALARFAVGEDLRSQPENEGHGVVLTASGGSARTWCRAWARPGRILGYMMDYDWGFGRRSPTPLRDVLVTIGSKVRAGTMYYQWWDCSTGKVIAEGELNHKGGVLRLGAPPFIEHIAFKIWR